MLNRKKNGGYAIVIVLMLIVVGTVALIMFNRESLFFTTVSGFFKRSRVIQSQALDGIELAKGDLRKITNNSRDPDLTNVDRFTATSTGSSSAAYDQGLYFDYSGAGLSRTMPLVPRISRTDGDFKLDVYYFPENPCTTLTPCPNNGTYDKLLPKRFLIVSQATNTKNGEIFTAESRIQVKLENYAEISYGISGVKCLKTTPCGPNDPERYPTTSLYRFSPAIYGRSYFDLPANRMLLDFGSLSNLSSRNEQHTFTDLVTFKNKTPNNQDHPFLIQTHDIQQQQVDGTNQVVPGLIKNPMVTFKKGYEEDKPLSTSDDTDPSSDLYFNDMKAMATTNGQDLSTVLPCPAVANAFGKKEINVCLKFVGNQVKRYDCKEYNDNFMGRIDTNVHPEAAYRSSVTWGYTNSSAGIFVPGSSGTAAQWVANGVDRYVGEHADVYTGSDSSVASFSTNGVFYCNPDDCDCNVHIKGIVDGQANIVAKNVVIEGDIRYQNQNKDSDDTLGVVAKNEIIIPAGIPQAATSMSSINYSQQEQVTLPDAEPPFTDNTPGGWPQNLAEAYLGITNFIPQISGQYMDRNAENPDYAEFVKWDTNLTNDKMYSSPTTLDLDGFMYAGNTVKIDGIFNPKDDNAPTATDNTGSYTSGVTFIVCTDPPTCNNYSYKNPGAPVGDPKALYGDNLGNFVTGSTGLPVKPLFHVDGLNSTNMYIGQTHDETTNANFNNLGYQKGEEVARPLNRGINIFGGLNSKFYFIADRMFGPHGHEFNMGFKRKLIQGDPRAAYLSPPGYPSTANVKVDELYQKTHSGKSAYLPQ